MKELMRQNLPKFSKPERDTIIKTVAEHILSLSSPMQMIFFGSVTGDSFDLASDVDVLLVYSDDVTADQGRRTLYRNPRPGAFPHPIEFICVSRERFEQMKDVGGICFVAHTEGIQYPSTKN